jgi:uncharacterized membrane protein
MKRAARRLAFSWGAALWLGLCVGMAGTPAKADFRVCNRTGTLVNLAIGYNGADDFETQGWWSLTPSACVVPLKGPINSRYVYLYATDIDANDILEGSFSMCIDKRKFLLVGINDCWRRGVQAVNFAEVDTLSSPDWTVFLREPANAR